MQNMSDLTSARVGELEALRNAHLSRAVTFERKGLNLSAWREHQAAAAVNYRLTVVKRKLAALEFTRRNTAPAPTDGEAVGSALGRAARAALAEARRDGLF